jgi:hypothetical protein
MQPDRVAKRCSGAAPPVLPLCQPPSFAFWKRTRSKAERATTRSLADAQVRLACICAALAAATAAQHDALRQLLSQRHARALGPRLLSCIVHVLPVAARGRQAGCGWTRRGCVAHDGAVGGRVQRGRYGGVCRIARGPRRAWLEAERAAGRIVAYGLATWDEPPPGHPSRLELHEVVDIAREVAGAAHGLRFVQLPVGAAAPEAFCARWHAARAPGAPDHAPLETGLTLLQAAAALRLGVVASGPLGEGGALRPGTPLAAALHALPHDSPLVATAGSSAAAQLLQFARSVPGVATALVGHKTPAHVAANTGLSCVPPLSAREFHDAAARLRSAWRM